MPYFGGRAGAVEITRSTVLGAVAAETSPLSISVDGFFKDTVLFDAGTKGPHRFSYNVNRTGNHHQTARSCDGTGLSKRGGDVGSLVNVDGYPGSRFAYFGRGRGARIFDVSGDHTVGERKQDLGYLADGLVAHRTKHEKQRPRLVRRGQRGTQGPCSGRIVGDINH